MKKGKLCTAFILKTYSQPNAFFIQLWKLKAISNWKTLPQREVLEAKSSAVVLLYSTECVLFSMMDVAKSSNRWLAG